LPPSVTARFAYVALFLVGFLALTVAFQLGGILVKRLSSITGFGARFFDQFEGQAPVLSLLATRGLYSLAPFRELEQHLLAWMHNTHHLRGDVRTLGQHLEECVLLPSPEERRRNIESLEAFHVYVTDPIASDDQSEFGCHLAQDGIAAAASAPMECQLLAHHERRGDRSAR
jgi:hypothetical protein